MHGPNPLLDPASLVCDIDRAYVYIFPIFIAPVNFAFPDSCSQALGTIDFIGIDGVGSGYGWRGDSGNICHLSLS